MLADQPNFGKRVTLYHLIGLHVAVSNRSVTIVDYTEGIVIPLRILGERPCFQD